MTDAAERTEGDLRLARAVPVGLTLATLLGVLLFAVAWLFDAFQIIDDAYFYARYAHNVLTEGALVWNAGEAPVFGPTSLAYTLWLVPFVALWPDAPALALLVGSTAAAAIFVLAMFRLVGRTVSGPVRVVAWMVFAFVLASNAREFAALVTNAMDTSLALAFLALLLAAQLQLERDPTPRRAGWTGALGALAFLVRADLLLFSFTVPLALAVFGRTAVRRAGITALIVASTVLAAELGIAWLTLGTPLPLSFYAKSTSFFSPAMYAMFADVPARELALFVISYRILFVIIAVDWLFAPRRFLRESTALEKGVALATFGFVAYYLFFVLQMMGANRRFYYPVLPAVVWLASLSLRRLLGAHIANWHSAWVRAPLHLRLLALAVVVLTSLPSIRATLDHEPAKRELACELGRFDLESLHDIVVDPPVWFGMAHFADLPELTIACTEVGMLGVVCRKHRIADLSGLNEPWITTGEFSADAFFERHDPDVIYMVFDTYSEIDTKIRSHSRFADYELFDVGTGIAVRRDSPAHAVIADLFERR